MSEKNNFEILLSKAINFYFLKKSQEDDSNKKNKNPNQNKNTFSHQKNKGY